MNGGGMLAPKFKWLKGTEKNTELTYLLAANRFTTSFQQDTTYSDLIKFPYFADTFERGDSGGGESRPKERWTLWGINNSIIIS